MGETKIEWSSKTWNPIRGCSVVSSGCKNCYAMNFATRFAAKGEAYEGLAYRNGGGAHWTGKVKFIEEHLTDPLKWRKPQKVFVNSMSDLFHESIPDEWIDKIFAVMGLSPQHTFQVLTKRPERMRNYVTQLAKSFVPLESAARSFGYTFSFNGIPLLEWPVRNVHLGVSVEDQKTADERIPLLLETPAAVRWVSYEPALGPLDISKYLARGWTTRGGIDWIVIGGESGHGARPFDLEWARKVISDCRVGVIAPFVKQLGANPILDCPEGEQEMGQFRDDGSARYWTIGFIKNKKGSDMNEWPEDLRVREFPQVEGRQQPEMR